MFSKRRSAYRYIRVTREPLAGPDAVVLFLADGPAMRLPATTKVKVADRSRTV